MIVLEQLGKHDEVLERVTLHPLFKSFRIREEAPPEREHFPAATRFPKWHGRTAEPPPETR